MEMTDGETTLCIVGAGFMGAQIALHCAAHGLTVWLADVSNDALDRAQAMHTQELNRRATAGTLDDMQKAAILSRLHHTRQIAEGAAGADLVIEAIVERVDVKRELFAELDRLCPPRTILATNSSSFPVSALEDATSRPDKVVNAHFYPPVWQRPLVELMGGTRTSEATMTRMMGFAHAVGLAPLVVNKESKGFLFNRVWRAIKRETLHLVDEGVASHEDVDRAWMISLNAPIGPFGLMDMVGLDVVRDIELSYFEASGNPSDAPPPILEDRIRRGDLGAKSGRGFYTYPHPAFQDPAWLRGAKSSTQ